MEKLPLKLINGRNILLDKSILEDEILDLESSLEERDFLNNINFSKKVLFSHEIKSNNSVEGINDDMFSIQNVIEKKSKIKDEYKRHRIINLYKGYKYILEHTIINKDSLKTLNKILSSGLLLPMELKDMGEYYRTRSGYILIGGRLDDSIEETMPACYVESFMDTLLDYLNNDNNLDMQSEFFIKSMIAHFYFVYIHPYFDINGRTSRTLSMWYLLNNKCYPYIIFNRAINYEFPNYDRSIIDAKKYGNVTFFIKNLLIGVKKELEKEFLIHGIEESTNAKLNTIDYQSLHYILRMKGIKTLLDFSKLYNKDNDKMRINDIYNEMIEPLLDNGILEVVRYTNKLHSGNNKNFEFKIKESLLRKDDKFIKYLK